MAQLDSFYAKQAEEQLKKVLADLKAIQDKTIEMSKTSLNFYGGKTASNPNELNNAISQIEKLNKKIKEQEALLKKLSQSQEKLGVASEKQKQASERTAQAIEKTNQVKQKGISLSKKAAETEKQASERTKKSIADTAGSAQERLNQTKQRSIDAANRAAAKAAKQAEATKRLSGAWAKLTGELKKAELEYRDLAAASLKAENKTKKFSKSVKDAERKVLKLRKQVDGIQKPIKRFGDNVGNYPKMFGAATSSLRGFIGAFGFTSGIFLFAAAVKDTFSRIREFDKAMQNISGILRVNRKDIADVEKEIKNVAGASVKTSRDVAKLAENLFTLGKSKEEVKKLLKPVNDLAIGLETSGAESAEFLVQNMNAFGASSDEAEKYADVLATIRTSTSLDFQKMKDSFQYITPISRLLNKDLAYTGALIGILADNTIKSQSAGRLIATAQQKLASENKTLAEAVDEVKNAQSRGLKETELLAFATKVFGGEAAKLGIILANNSEALEINAQKIRDNKGALKDLTDEQLKSMDAMIQMLDSSWEKLIFTIENGTGSMSTFFKDTLTFLTKATEGLILFNKNANEIAEEVTYSELKKTYKELGDEAKDLAIQEADMSREKIDDINKEIIALTERNKSLKEGESALGKGFRYAVEISSMGGMTTPTASEYMENEKRVEQLKNSLGYQKGILTASEELIALNDKKDNVLIKEEVKINERNVTELRKLIKLEQKKLPLSTKRSEAIPIQKKILALEKEIADILGGKGKTAKREKIKAIGLEIKETDTLITTINRHIDALEKTRDLHLKGTKEYDDLTDSIKDYTDALDQSIKVEDLNNNKGLQGEVNAIESKKEALKQLREETEAFIKTVSDSALGELGMGSLTQFFDGTFDKLLEGADTLEEKFAITFAGIADVAKEAYDIISSSSQASFDKQFSRLEKQKALSLRFAGEGEEGRVEIERQYEAKRAVILKKQAESEKKQALFSIALSTAKGVVAALAQPVPNIPLSVAIGVIGLAKAALVSSTPIPEFKDGVNDFSGGLAIVGDGGKSEYIRTPNGNVSKTPSKDTLVNLPKGTDVFKDENTFMNQMYKELSLHDIMPFSRSIGSAIMPSVTEKGIKREDLEEVFRNEISKLSNVIKNKKETLVNIDRNGFNTFRREGNIRYEDLSASARGDGSEV